MLMLKTLKQGGKFILKLTSIDNEDEEIIIMKRKLLSILLKCMKLT